ncbi:hypothetical protein [Streptomyces sp. NPDC054783]
MTGPDTAEYDELDDDFAAWAGPPRGTHHPKEEDVTEDQALPPEGPPGVSTPTDQTGDASPS